MNLLRNPEQAALADLHAFGAGLLHRYRQLVDARPDHPLAETLKKILEARRPLLAGVAGRERARGELPEAPDQEVNELRAATDRALGALFGPEFSRRRLADAEAAWREHLAAARDHDWSEDERALLAALEADARRAADVLARTLLE